MEGEGIAGCRFLIVDCSGTRLCRVLSPKETGAGRSLIEDPLEITATVQDVKNENVAPLDAVNDDIGSD